MKQGLSLSGVVHPDMDGQQSAVYQGCDTMVSTGASSKGGATLFAKNSDRPADEAQPLELHAAAHSAVSGTQFVELDGSAAAFRHVGSRPDWCWGYEHGFNEHQVVIGNEALPSLLPETDEQKLVGMEIVRLALERGSTAQEAVSVITALVEKHGQGKFSNDAGVRTYDNIYMVADPGEAYVVETIGHEWAVWQVSGVHSISNVSRMDGHARVSTGAESTAIRYGLFDPANGAEFSWSTAYSAVANAKSGARRQSRSSSILAHHDGGIDFGKLMLTLSDHGAPESDPAQFESVPGDLRGICTHPQHEGGVTAASLVADLCADGSRLPVYWCAMYAPCMALFFPIFIEGELPEVLSVGGGSHSDDSPWWMFHALGQEGFAGGPDRMKEIHEGWWDLQKGMFGSAYAMATQGREMIDNGDQAGANEMLTRYMAENAENMLRVGREMLSAGAVRAR
jgi:dipeptidase